MIEIPEQSIEQLEFNNVTDLLECIEKNFDRTVKIRKKILKIDESVLPRGNFLYILEYIGRVSYKKKYIYTLLSVIRKDKYAKLDLYENDKYKIVNRNISKQDDRKIYQMDWGKEVWFYNIDQVLKEIDNEEIISLIKNRHADKAPKYRAMYARNGKLLRIERIRELLYHGEYLK